MKKILTAAIFTLPLSVAAGDAPNNAIRSETNTAVDAAFDLTATTIIPTRKHVIFRHLVSGAAGASKPVPIGKLQGATVNSYVWPTSLDSGAVGFDAAKGTLALAVTAHPDFDDTPLYDENGDGNKANDGSEWHTHWVVLTGDEACGKGALKVRDVVQGQQEKMPATAPGLPILLDSPGFPVTFQDHAVDVRIPKEALVGVGGVSFDGVTADLKVNETGKNPLLCVVQVHDVASGDLSLPAEVTIE